MTLEEIIDAADYSDCYFKLNKLNLLPDCFSVDFSIRDNDSSDAIPVSMNVAGCVDYFIAKNDYSGYSHFEQDHPLLWQFTDMQRELFVTGKTTEIRSLSFDLFMIFHSLFGEYRSFDPEIMRAVKAGYGSFDTGPGKLLDLYARKLEEHGIRCSVIGNYQQPTADLGIFFLGSSYFIGERFEFKRNDEPNGFPAGMTKS